MHERNKNRCRNPEICFQCCDHETVKVFLNFREDEHAEFPTEVFCYLCRA